MKVKCRLPIGVVGAGCCLMIAAQPVAAQQGMMVHIDPTTKKIIPSRAPGLPPLSAPADQKAATSSSHQGLTETPGTTPAGGYKLNLQGRFQQK